MLRKAMLILAAWCGVSPAAALAEDSAVVLMYHRFGEDRFPSTSVGVDPFDQHLAYLRENDYRVIPLAVLLDALDTGASLPPRAVVITIDDAYRSVYEVAYPRLKAQGFPFTVFVATDPVDQGLPDYMSWAQMREMAEGGASFANHGASHRSMVARVDGQSGQGRLAAISADIARGRARLEAELVPEPRAFAYPYGEFDEAAASRVAGAGYVAFGQHSGAVGRQADRRALPRFPMAEEFADLDGFRTKVASLPLPVAIVVPWDPVTTERRPSIEVTLSQPPERWSELACFVSGHGRIEPRWLDEGRRFSVHVNENLGLGRQRVNCTAPTASGRFQWFSHPWLIVDQAP